MNGTTPPREDYDVWANDPSTSDIISNQVKPDGITYHDRIIFCHGFEFDKRAFKDEDCQPEVGKYHMRKYPKMLPNYESTNVPGIEIILKP